MRGRLVAAGVAALMVLGGTVAYGAATSQDVACTITDNTLTCPLPAPPAPVTETATVTAAPVTVTTTATVTATQTVTASSVPTTSAAPVTPTSSTPPAPPSTTSTPPATTTATTSAAPATKNCAPAPSACGFPDATNTGAKGTLRKVPSQVTSGPGWSYGSGYIRIDGAGTVLDSIECACSIDVNGNNVTVSNVKLTFGGEWFAVAIRHAKGTLIVDTTIAPPAGGERLLAGIKNIYGDETGTTVRRVNVAGSSTGVQIDSGLIEDSYIHDMGLKAGDHINGTTSNGGSTLLTIRHNTVFNQFGQTDAVSLFQDFGAQKNRVIDNNLLAGGGYTIYGGANAGKETLATGIKITNNRISKMYFPQGGSYGWLAAWNPSGAGNVLTGNVWDDSGSAIN